MDYGQDATKPAKANMAAKLTYDSLVNGPSGQQHGPNLGQGMDPSASAACVYNSSLSSSGSILSLGGRQPSWKRPPGQTGPAVRTSWPSSD
eukprot:CAMPEP_0174831316 /NCGR_PEP_ID=MMETSP1114-20130205/3020_1 /TAXON_ID=312471 /ORGANISM="Neobodo designis, Strain CCAP 1951/1" /LENGTH=90 /DNA_ID=CAMNT_0016065137 /DNA_START=106 /DNA_END=378 /DNA_ORIENTATION=-